MLVLQLTTIAIAIGIFSLGYELRRMRRVELRGVKRLLEERAILVYVTNKGPQPAVGDDRRDQKETTE